MQNITDHDAVTSRFHEFAEELSAGCDSDFDTACAVSTRKTNDGHGQLGL